MNSFEGRRPAPEPSPGMRICRSSSTPSPNSVQEPFAQWKCRPRRVPSDLKVSHPVEMILSEMFGHKREETSVGSRQVDNNEISLTKECLPTAFSTFWPRESSTLSFGSLVSYHMSRVQRRVISHVRR
jgi:hypothetical protein